jgi:CHASE2 domain-containing sensor protein
MVRSIAAQRPKVMGLDMIFDHDTENSKDYELFLALESCKSLVMASLMENENDSKRLGGSLDIFLSNARTGFINTIDGKGKLHKLDEFQVSESFNGRIEYHFAIMIAMIADSIKAVSFVGSNTNTVTVDYSSGKRKLKTYTDRDVISGKVPDEAIEDKIVLFGYLGPSNEDKFYSPLSDDPSSNQPDMYGLEYLANIIVQILSSK